MYSGELARVAGVSVDTIRYYERSGLLPAAPRSACGYRLFPPEAKARIHLIRAALGIGFSVRELAEVLRQRQRGGSPCHRVRGLVASKLVALEARVRELQSWRVELRTTLTQWDLLLAKTPRGKPARLLEAFACTQPKSHIRSSKFGLLTRPHHTEEGKE